MKVLFQTCLAQKINCRYQKSENKNVTIIPKDNSPLPSAYTPNFGLRKADFQGFDLFCINKFKAPIEKFKTKYDFDTWIKKIFESKTEIYQYKSMEPAQETVKKSLLSWKDFLCNNIFFKKNPSLSLIAFDSIVQDIKPDTFTLPPALNKNVFYKTIAKFEELFKKDSNKNLNFNRIYQNNLRLEYLQNDAEGIKKLNGNKSLNDGIWVRIPSKENDPENFENNILKLRSLSYKTWCTRNIAAIEDLEEGDFYIYLENTHPKVCLRFYGNRIGEIEGELNNQKIPLDYLDTILAFKEKEGFMGYETGIRNALEKRRKLLSEKLN